MSAQYPVGHEIRIERDPIIMRRIDDCEHCGAELWTYNDRGRCRRVGDLDGHPVLTPHTWLIDCPGATTSSTAHPKDTPVHWGVGAADVLRADGGVGG
jgi:hypothetical protein